MLLLELFSLLPKFGVSLDKNHCFPFASMHLPNRSPCTMHLPSAHHPKCSMTSIPLDPSSSIGLPLIFSICIHLAMNFVYAVGVTSYIEGEKKRQ